MHPESVPAIVFGGTGYVAGELLRLLAGHPRFRVHAAVSTSSAGENIVKTFPHLRGSGLDPLRFVADTDWANGLSGKKAAVFFATPHGATAALADRVLNEAEKLGVFVHAVDLSADFRLRDPAEYAAVYGKPHGAPARLREFHCAVPEHAASITSRHVAHPGCFTTCVTLAAYPFIAMNLVEDEVFVAAVTGSSGSGRTPIQGTHHPERAHAMYAYNPLGHRHEPEMRFLLSAARPGADVRVDFVPHSGPFVRGIHATLRMKLKKDANAKDLAQRVNDFHGPGSFVVADTAMPKLTEVAGTNRAALGIAVRERTLVVTSVIDNLTKGAAGGGVQWMNRLFAFDEDAGLTGGGLGWY